MDDLHLRIRRWRQLAGLKQLDLARAIGASPSSVCAWEKGTAAPRARKLAAIAAACGVSIRVFFGTLPPAPGAPDDDESLGDTAVDDSKDAAAIG